MGRNPHFFLSLNSVAASNRSSDEVIKLYHAPGLAKVPARGVGESQIVRLRTTYALARTFCRRASGTGAAVLLPLPRQSW